MACHRMAQSVIEHISVEWRGVVCHGIESSGLSKCQSSGMSKSRVACNVI